MVKRGNAVCLRKRHAQRLGCQDQRLRGQIAVARLDLLQCGNQRFLVCRRLGENFMDLADGNFHGRSLMQEMKEMRGMRLGKGDFAGKKSGTTPGCRAAGVKSM